MTNKPKGKKITFVKCKSCCCALHNATIASNLHIQGKYDRYKKRGNKMNNKLIGKNNVNTYINNMVIMNNNKATIVVARQ
jgi:hypothetical protein